MSTQIINLENHKLSEALINEVANYIHDIYEEQAKKVGWETQDSYKVRFDDLPEENKQVMLYTAEQVIRILLHQQIYTINNYMYSERYLQECIENSEIK